MWPEGAGRQLEISPSTQRSVYVVSTCWRMSVTRERTVQMRRSVGMAEVRKADFSALLLTVERTGFGGAGGGVVSGKVAKRPVWRRDSEGGGGADGRLPERSFPLRARRLARVGGLSSLSDIPPESSIVRRDFGVSGGCGQRSREAG